MFPAMAPPAARAANNIRELDEDSARRIASLALERFYPVGALEATVSNSMGCDDHA